MLPAAVRALSFLTCGVNCHQSQLESRLGLFFIHFLFIFLEYSRVFLSLLFGSPATAPLMNQLRLNTDLILAHILSQKLSHHKLFYSISQLLGCYLWSCLYYGPISSSFRSIFEDQTFQHTYLFLFALFRQNHFMKVNFLVILHSSWSILDPNTSL